MAEMPMNAMPSQPLVRRNGFCVWLFAKFRMLFCCEAEHLAMTRQRL